MRAVVFSMLYIKREWGSGEGADLAADPDLADLFADTGADWHETRRVARGKKSSRRARGGRYAVRKGDTETLDKLNAGIKAVVTSGKYDEITKKYPELTGMLVVPTF